MVRLKPGQALVQANAALQGAKPQIREATLPFIPAEPAYIARYLRTEIGLRIALGARPSGITGLVFRRVGVLIAVGLGLGLAGGLWLARFVAPLLFQVEARDPLMFAAAAGVLAAVGVLAAWAPARRAARFDPAALLREA